MTEPIFVKLLSSWISRTSGGADIPWLNSLTAQATSKSISEVIVLCQDVDKKICWAEPVHRPSFGIRPGLNKIVQPRT